MGKAKNNPILQHTSGRVGKTVVYKTYAYGTVISKYPDMSNVIASEEQKSGRNRFASAVAFAKEVLKDPEQSKLFKGNKKKGITKYQQAIRFYMKNNPK